MGVQDSQGRTQQIVDQQLDGLRSNARFPYSRILSITIACIALAGFCFNLAAFYPGLISADSGDQYMQAVAGSFSDWHPPFMAWLWSGMLKIIPGAAGMTVLISAGIWGGVACFAWGIRERCGWWCLLCFLVPLLPMCLSFSGIIWKDVLHAALWLAASGLLFLSRNRPVHAGKRVSWTLMIGLAFLVCGVLTRPNGIFAAIPFLMWALHRRSVRATLIGTVLCVFGTVVISTVLSSLLHVKHTHPESSIEIYGLGGISYYAGENVIPGRWSTDQTRMLVRNCYRPHAWDNYSWSTGRSFDDCQFVTTALREQQVWGSRALMLSWITEIFRHPTAFLRSRLASYQYFLKTPGLKTFLDSASTISSGTIVPAKLSSLARRINEVTTYAAAKPISVPVYWSAVCAICLLVLGFLWEKSSSCGRFGFVLASSAAIYTLTYVPIGVASDLRYFYWSFIAIALAVVLGLADWVPRRVTIQSEARRSTGITITAATLAMCLIFTAHFPANWLMKTAPITVTATGSHNPASASSEVWLQQIRDADGGITAGSLSTHWLFTDGAWYSSGQSQGPLTWQDQGSGVGTTLAFRSHAGSGIAHIQAAGFDEKIDLYSKSFTWKDVTVPLVRQESAPFTYLITFFVALLAAILALTCIGTRIFR
jgi:hypothetical protein